VTSTNRWGFPDLGIGIGLRSDHYPYILNHNPKIDFFEALTENYLDTKGRPYDILHELAERYPIVMHGVAMSPGSSEPIDFEYLDKVKDLAESTGALWLGDHICWTGVAGHTGHDLYPIPYNAETLKHLVERVRIIQDHLERPLILENASTYLTFHASSMSEEEFIKALCEESGCGLLLDINNVYVSCRNHGHDPIAYLDTIPPEYVVQLHLAGHTDKGTHCIDTHDGEVCDAVWELYGHFCKRAGNRSTILEWDDHIPDFDEVHLEAMKAAAYRTESGGDTGGRS